VNARFEALRRADNRPRARVFYGLRRGELRGLRWDDIDFDGGTIHIHQQLQRVRGELFLAPVKTQAGRRGLPLLDVAAQALKLLAERQAA
jgi:integrase